MKVLQIFILIFGLATNLNAQIDCGVTNKIFVRDYDRNLVKGAKLEIFRIEKGFNKIFAFSPQKVENDVHLISSFTGTILTGSDKHFYIGESYWLKVTAENFKIAERPLKFDRCKSQDITIVLEQINQKINLSGIVYDANGAVIVKAKVKVTNKNNESFETETNDEGVYSLKLLPDSYEIEFVQSGFKKKLFKNFKVVNSTYGKINQDIVLDIIDDTNCGAGGCIQRDTIDKMPSQETSNKISQRPLEELPKAQNKTNRKNKN